MKNIFLLFGLCLSLSLNAQDLNEGFEKWKSSGQPAPFNWFEPEGWGTTNPRTQVTFAGVRKSSVRKSGFLAAELNTVNLFGKLSPSIMSIGKLQIDFITGVYYYRLNSGGIKLDKKPNGIKFWHKFSSPGVNDVGLTKVFVKRYDQALNKSTILYSDSISLQKVDAFAETTLAINFPSFNAQTDSLGILFYSGIDGKIEGNGVLVIDDLEIIYASNSEDLSYSNVKVYPNPSNIGDDIIIDTRSFSNEKIEFNLLNGLGEKMNIQLTHDQNGFYRISTSDLISGYYILSDVKGSVKQKIYIN